MSKQKQPGRLAPAVELKETAAAVAEPIVATEVEKKDTGKGRAGLKVRTNLADLAEQIQREHEHFKSALRATLEHARAVGKLLVEAKEQCLRERKGWGTWLSANVSFCETTACNYMRIVRNWARLKSATVADMGVREALGFLSNPRTRQEPATVPKPAEKEPQLLQTSFVDGEGDAPPTCGVDSVPPLRPWPPMPAPAPEDFERRLAESERNYQALLQPHDHAAANTPPALERFFTWTEGMDINEVDADFSQITVGGALDLMLQITRLLAQVDLLWTEASRAERMARLAEKPRSEVVALSQRENEVSRRLTALRQAFNRATDLLLELEQRPYQERLAADQKQAVET
jgi:hypothetical protein